MTWFLYLAASAAYTAGAVCMKLSQGLTKPWPSAAMWLLFAAGAGLQAIGMRHKELGVAYLIVLGMEAVLAFFLGVLIFGDALNPRRLAALVLIAGGIWLLDWK